MSPHVFSCPRQSPIRMYYETLTLIGGSLVYSRPLPSTGHWRDTGGVDMARNVRSAQLETRTARLKLELRKKPYTVRVAPGVRLGYRRNASAGTWSVIAADGKSGNWVKKFGYADDHEEANGEQVLTFWEAQERARKLARGGKNAEEDDPGRPVIVREALAAYQADLIARGGDVHNVARVRGHLPNTLAGKTVALLTARELRRFRDNLLAKKLRGSSVNRISSALRAALNLAAAHDQRINNHTAWRIGLATIFDAAQARNVILSDQVIRGIVAAAFGISMELGLLVEIAAVTGARVSQIAGTSETTMAKPDDVSGLVWAVVLTLDKIEKQTPTGLAGLTQEQLTQTVSAKLPRHVSVRTLQKALALRRKRNGLG